MKALKSLQNETLRDMTAKNAKFKKRGETSLKLETTL